MISKIADRHLSREACIYIRQSTMGQVRFNQESTERQYNLAGKAQSLGWSPERIRILDRDLGQSGARVSGREDFKALVCQSAPKFLMTVVKSEGVQQREGSGLNVATGDGQGGSRTGSYER